MESALLMLEVDQLSKSNFYSWIQKSWFVLVYRGLEAHNTDEPLDSDKDAKAETHQFWLCDDTTAKVIIGHSPSDERLDQFRDLQTASGVWKTILKLFLS